MYFSPVIKFFFFLFPFAFFFFAVYTEICLSISFFFVVLLCPRSCRRLFRRLVGRRCNRISLIYINTHTQKKKRKTLLNNIAVSKFDIYKYISSFSFSEFTSRPFFFLHQNNSRHPPFFFISSHSLATKKAATTTRLADAKQTRLYLTLRLRRQ